MEIPYRPYVDNGVGGCIELYMMTEKILLGIYWVVYTITVLLLITSSFCCTSSLIFQVFVTY